MKNKWALFLLISYIIVIFLVSFLKDLMVILTSPAYILFKDENNAQIATIVSEYFIYFLVYFVFGGLLMIVLFEKISSSKLVFLYTILIIFATVSLSMMCASFTGQVNYFKYAIKCIISLFGASISFFLLKRKENYS